MFNVLLFKEIKAIIMSSGFPLTFGICVLLVMVSLWTGIREYQAERERYHSATQLAGQELMEENSYSGLATRIYRRPDPMQILVSGTHYDIGFLSQIGPAEPVRLVQSLYSQDSLYALFRFMDLSFIVRVVLSLFAILFSYNSISQEHERGTLRLVFSHAVSKPLFLMAKFVGSWIGLMIPMIIPLMLSILMLLVFRIDFSATHWIKLAWLIGGSGLYLTVFIIMGIWISSLARTSSNALMILLSLWLLLTLIIPRGAMMAAARLYPVPSPAQIQAQLDQYSQSQWDSYIQTMEKNITARNDSLAGLSEEEQQHIQEKNEWKWAEEREKERNRIEGEIEQHDRKLRSDLLNRQKIQETIGFSLARISPATLFQLFAVSIAGTDTGLKSRYENQLSDYRDALNRFAQEKQKQYGDIGGIRIQMSSTKGISISTPTKHKLLEISDMPQFRYILPESWPVFFSALIDVSLMILYWAGFSALALIAFMRRDLR